jgi:hypothetical protein
MKLSQHRLQLFIAEEITAYLSEAGASQLIGQYNIDVITEDTEVVTVLGVVQDYINRHSDWQYSMPEYSQIGDLLSEATSLVNTVIVKKDTERAERRGAVTQDGNSALRNLLQQDTPTE